MKMPIAIHKKTKFSIVNGGFWPESQIIGEGLLLLAESMSKNFDVSVITQSKENIKKAFSSTGRGHGIAVYDLLSRTSSSTNLIKRII